MQSLNRCEVRQLGEPILTNYHFCGILYLMPPVNLYYRNPEQEQDLIEATEPLRDHVADELSSPERTLVRDQVSVRIIQSSGRGMLADVEMDILAAPNVDRTERQDEICDSVRAFIINQIPGLQDAKVWLSLQELGYSFGE